MKYFLRGNGIIFWTTETENGVFSETDTTGRYQQYLEWLSEGNTPEPWEAE